jgi:spoIIIJ-associated protein
MLKEAVATAATTEEAVEKAKSALRPPAYAELVIEVLEPPQKKRLFFGGSDAKVRVSYEENAYAAGEYYLRTVLKKMDADAQVLTIVQDEGVQYAIACGDNYGYVAGRHGEVLDALQFLTRLVVSRGNEEYRHVGVNVGDYRERREITLQTLAEKTAVRVKRLGKNITLDPMSAYDRRTVHAAIGAIEGVSSFSVGEDSTRRVVVAPEEKYKKVLRPNTNKPGDAFHGGKPGAHAPRTFSGGRPTGERPPYKPQGGAKPYFKGDNAPHRSDGFPRPVGSSGQGFRTTRNTPAQTRPPRADTPIGKYGRITPKPTDPPEKNNDPTAS